MATVATGFAILLLAVSAGVSSGGSAALGVGLVGVLLGASLTGLGIWMAEHPSAHIGLELFANAGVLKRHNLALAGVIMTSSAVTVVAGEIGLAVDFGMLALFLLGLSIVTIAALGE